MKKSILILLAAAAFGLAAPMAFVPAAWAAVPAGDANCLEPIRLYDWKVVDNRTLIVTDRMHHDFKVALKPGCQDLKWAFGLAFAPFSSSRLSCMDRGDKVLVPASGGMPRQTCFIDSIQAYTPEMSHADAVAKAMDKPH
jgi:hypothetical protein